jgi:putative membrane protein
VLLTLPVTLLTFGLFLIVINAIIILLVDAFVSGFQVSGFWIAVLFSILLSIFQSIFFSIAERK